MQKYILKISFQDQFRMPSVILCAKIRGWRSGARDPQNTKVHFLKLYCEMNVDKLYKWKWSR